jgi:hypothetical protein
VFAAIEVEGHFQAKDVEQCVEAISRVRTLAKYKRYVEYSSTTFGGRLWRPIRLRVLFPRVKVYVEDNGIESR